MSNKQKGQAAVEFALILPVLMFLMLGTVQVALIFVNILMVDYAAFAVARVAVAYPEQEKGAEQAGKAEFMLKRMIDSTGNLSIWDGIVKNLKSAAADYVFKSKVEIEDVKLKNASHSFKKVTITYNMPLTVPIVNKIMGTLLFRLLPVGDIGIKLPYCPIRASSLMRIPVVNKDE